IDRTSGWELELLRDVDWDRRQWLIDGHAADVDQPFDRVPTTGFQQIMGTCDVGPRRGPVIGQMEDNLAAGNGGVDSLRAAEASLGHFQWEAGESRGMAEIVHHGGDLGTLVEVQPFDEAPTDEPGCASHQYLLTRKPPQTLWRSGVSGHPRETPERALPVGAFDQLDIANRVGTGNTGRMSFSHGIQPINQHGFEQVVYDLRRKA